MTTTFADGEQAGGNNGHGDGQRTAICLPKAGRPGDYTPGRSPFCPACGQPFAEHLGLVGTCGLWQEEKARVAVLEEEQKILIQERKSDRRTMEILRDSRDRYRRMAGISSDHDTAESVREKFSEGEGEGCGHE
jgi:hypothetical protein